MSGLWVFMSQPDFACNSHALWRYVIAHTDYMTAWIVKRKEHRRTLRERGIRAELYDTLTGNELIGEADVVIANSNTFFEVPKREGQRFINLWHGSGIKAHDHFDPEMDIRHVNRLRDYFSKVDLMCVQSLDDRFKLAAQLNYDLRRVTVTGQPRLDIVRTSDGKASLRKIFGGALDCYEHLIFFAPSFRANMSTHAGNFVSDNIFRLPDYDDGQLRAFLEEQRAAMIYKLHPIEQTAFSGREFAMNEHCFRLTDEMLFEVDVRYDELLSAFDALMTDYSSIAFDYLLLDRPIVYLAPDLAAYREEKGFVFHHVEDYMPGDRAEDLAGMLRALRAALSTPEKYARDRARVFRCRFDYTDDSASERVYSMITGYRVPSMEAESYRSPKRARMPSAAEHLMPYLAERPMQRIVDATKEIAQREDLLKAIEHGEEVLYITEELPDIDRRVSIRNACSIADIDFYWRIKDRENVKILYIDGGVDYERFAAGRAERGSDRTRIGFAGTIDNRIYFAMVQYLCESFPDCEFVFAGHLFGERPEWMNGYDNLRFQEAGYEELPDIIAGFDVAILPIFRDYYATTPVELFQYLACGKPVVTSAMTTLPTCRAIYRSRSVDEAAIMLQEAVAHSADRDRIEDARYVAKVKDWARVAGAMGIAEYSEEGCGSKL